MKRKILFGFASVMMLVFFAGCGKVPQEQMDAATLAIEEARLAEADIYAPAEYAALMDSLSVAMAAVETQKSKTFKNFKEPKLQLERIAASAVLVQEQAAEAKEEVRMETEALISQVNGLIAETKDLMLQAPKGKEGAAALELIRNEMTVVEGSVAEASDLFIQENYMAARDKVKAAMENVMAINAELQEAIAKSKGRK
ncbi:MAG: hypothetical protein ACNA7V_12625 [Bacteroidales bacterium]